MNPQLPTWYIFCDESVSDPYMVIGGIWCPAEKLLEVQVELETFQLCCDVIETEMKFKKIRGHNLGAYKEFVDIFFAHPELRFRCILVPKAKLDLKTFHDGDGEVAFYKFFRIMLKQRIECGNGYIIHTDNRTMRHRDSLTELRRYINLSFPTCRVPPVKHIEPHDSSEDVLIQLTDVLVGAVQCAWNKNATADPKLALVAHICKRLGFKALDCPSNFSKFEMFNWQPKAELERGRNSLFD